MITELKSVAQEREELILLAKTISRHDELYYQNSAPEIEDKDYDSLLSRYRSLAERYPDLDIIQGKVGAPPQKGFRKIKHHRPMISLSNVFSAAEAKAFILRAAKASGLNQDVLFPLSGELKIDGVSFSARFEKGVLKTGVTRGDGIFGEEVTASLLRAEGFPGVLSEVITLEVRGEVYLERSALSEVNRLRESAGYPPYMNPRNAASGMLRRLEGNAALSSGLRYFAYTVFFTENPPRSHSESLARLADLGFRTNPLNRILRSAEDMDRYYNDILAVRADLPYDIDGLVYKIDSLPLQEQLGAAGRFPRWAAAHKFPTEEVPARIERIDVQVGRTGVLTPVARLTPVLVGGVTVSNLSLHNADYIREKDVREGDWALVIRAGEVIPQISRIIPDRRTPDIVPWHFPETCPACGAAVIRTQDEAAVRCPNKAGCPEQSLERLKHFVSRAAFDIRGLGEKRIAALIEAGKLKIPADIFRLTSEDVLALEREGERSVENLIHAINERRTIPFHRFIYALGIRGLGAANSEQLALHFGSVERFLEACESLATAGAQSSSSAISDLPAALPFLSREGLSEVSVERIASFFADDDERLSVRSLLEVITVLPRVPDEGNNSHPLHGKNIVVTGTFEGHSRERMRALLKSWGAKPLDSVSAKTDLVFAGESAGNKRDKAYALGIPVLGPEDWKKYSAGP